MANLNPTRELTATQIILLSVNIPEKLGAGKFSELPHYAAIDYLSTGDFLLHSNPIMVKTFLD